MVMISFIFWDITSCSSVESPLTFRRIISPLSSVTNQHNSACYLLHASFLLDLFFDLDDVSDMFLRNIGWLFNGLHGVISRKIYNSLVKVVSVLFEIRTKHIKSEALPLERSFLICMYRCWEWQVMGPRAVIWERPLWILFKKAP
jgi:hypothetical protein